MADDFTITGAEDLVEAGRRLKKAGDKGRDGVLATMKREINADTKQMRKAAQTRIRAALPQRGGLSKWAGALPSTSVRVERDRASVKVRLDKRGHDLASMNRRGVARHPLYGNRKRWFGTDVPKGFYEDSVRPEAEAMSRTVSEAIGRAVERTAMKGGV